MYNVQTPPPGIRRYFPVMTKIGRHICEVPAGRAAHDKIEPPEAPTVKGPDVRDNTRMLVEGRYHRDELDAEDVEALEGEAVAPAPQATKQVQSSQGPSQKVRLLLARPSRTTLL